MRVNLSTSSSNGNKAFYAALFVIVFAALIFIMGLVLEWMFKYNISLPNYYSSKRWDGFYEKPDDSLDIVFLGTSHCIYSYDPEVFDQKLGTDSYNMGSIGQRLDTTYYIAKEVTKHHQPSVIVLDIFSDMLQSNRSIFQVQYNYMHMEESDIKKEMWNDCFTFKDKFEYTFKILRYRTQLRKFMTNVLNQLISPDEIDSDTIIDGYIKSTSVVDINLLINNNMYRGSHFEKASDWQIEYLDMIVALCKQNDIDLVLVTAPIPPQTFEYAKNYEVYHRYISDYANRNDLEFIDYNVINQEEALFTNDMYGDSDHMNDRGAAVVSADLAERLRPYIK